MPLGVVWVSDPTPTLVEFLNARITEDEAEARDRGTHAMIGHLWKHLPESDYNAIQADWLARSRRVLAECTARRRLVELHTSAGGGAHECPEDSSYTGFVRNCPTLRLLAAPFASHEDFSPSWVLEGS